MLALMPGDIRLKCEAAAWRHALTGIGLNGAGTGPSNGGNDHCAARADAAIEMGIPADRSGYAGAVTWQVVDAGSSFCTPAAPYFLSILMGPVLHGLSHAPVNRSVVDFVITEIVA